MVGPGPEAGEEGELGRRSHLLEQSHEGGGNSPFHTGQGVGASCVYVGFGRTHWNHQVVQNGGRACGLDLSPELALLPWSCSGPGKHKIS